MRGSLVDWAIEGDCPGWQVGGGATRGSLVEWVEAGASMDLSAQTDTQAGGEACLGSSAGQEEGGGDPGCLKAKGE